MKSALDKWEKIGGWFLVVALAGAVVTLAACGEKPQPQATPPKLFQQERDALEKAKGVEQTEAKRAENLKQEAEKQSQ